MTREVKNGNFGKGSYLDLVKKTGILTITNEENYFIFYLKFGDRTDGAMECKRK